MRELKKQKSGRGRKRKKKERKRNAKTCCQRGKTNGLAALAYLLKAERAGSHTQS